jgi:hypothetical protein
MKVSGPLRWLRAQTGFETRASAFIHRLEK